ncbi:MAG: hypothetical protein ACXAC8_06380 [Candidatus Hodarchaeales archaeon]|jgi:hypothetical protein
MSKIKSLIGILAGVLIAIVFTLGSIVDLLFDTGISWLDWRLFVVVPIWLVVIVISFMIIGISYSGLTSKFDPFMQEIHGYGELMAIDAVVKSEVWQSKWSELQALGREFADETDQEKKLKLWVELKQEFKNLGETLVAQGVLASEQWVKVWKSVEDFDKKVLAQSIDFFDQMYLKWLFNASAYQTV